MWQFLVDASLMCHVLIVYPVIAFKIIVDVRTIVVCYVTAIWSLQLYAETNWVQLSWYKLVKRTSVDSAAVCENIATKFDR